jgi:hypothetical protein
VVPLRGDSSNRVIHRDVLGNETIVTLPRSYGRRRYPDIDLETQESGQVHYSLREGEPTSAAAWTEFALERRRGDWRARTATKTRLTCTRDAFRLEAELRAWEGDAELHARTWDLSFPRDHV